MDLDELVDHWTLLKDERELVAGKRGPTRLGFALLLKFYAGAGQSLEIYSRLALADAQQRYDDVIGDFPV